MGRWSKGVVQGRAADILEREKETKKKTHPNARSRCASKTPPSNTPVVCGKRRRGGRKRNRKLRTAFTHTTHADGVRYVRLRRKGERCMGSGAASASRRIAQKAKLGKKNVVPEPKISIRHVCCVFARTRSPIQSVLTSPSPACAPASSAMPACAMFPYARCDDTPASSQAACREAIDLCEAEKKLGLILLFLAISFRFIQTTVWV